MGDSLKELLDEFQNLSVLPTDAPPTLSPPIAWSTLAHNEYQSLPKFIRVYIKYGAILVATFIALDHTSHHIQSFICQWCPEFHFCLPTP